MPNISTAAEQATCGHGQTGSNRVSIAGAGVSRVEVDTAGGLIIGPGSQNVFVEGFKVSLHGDVITTHGLSPHAAATTSAFPVNTRVTAGTGFSGDVISTGDAPKPNVVTDSFDANYSSQLGVIDLHCSGAGVFPPQDMRLAWINCNFGPGSTQPPSNLQTPPELRYFYRVSNRGADTSQPFSMGFWRFTDGIDAPNQAILTLASQSYYPTSVLEDEQRIPALAPGQSVSGSFVWGGTYSAGSTYAFSVYADIYGEATEPDEKNSAPTIYVRVDNECQ